ncbi:hypothetical protein ABW02_20255 [Niallia circulans]|uniref:Uncharacterized protein n=2 Tax=Niallia circulans TaxID=1397 RepID=A0A0J1IAU4_NIACI|nr:hypothetical protein ABW02_20255 [Niallia circulans]
MDFFLNEIAYHVNGMSRLNSTDYIPWNEDRFRRFLEEKCNLSKENKIEGRIVTHHNEAFYFIEELIEKQLIQTPIEWTHIDAHSDLGLGDSGWYYISSELMHYDIHKRIKYVEKNKIKLSNYMAFLLPFGWLSKVDFVHHDNWDFDDFFSIYLKNFNDQSGFFEFKTFEKGLEAGYLIENARKLKPVQSDSVIPFEILREDTFQTDENFNYLIFCQSPQYTPESADFMLKIIKEYIIEI